jgi:hypothetical protein
MQLGKKTDGTETEWDTLVMYTAQTRTVALSSHVRFVFVYRRYEKLNSFETPTII